MTTNGRSAWDERMWAMDMLDYRMHYAVMATEERVDNLRRERSLRRQMRQRRSQPESRPNGQRRQSLAAFIGLLVPDRGPR